ncbi:DUF3784 domain-containing protein [Clostridium sp. CM028]|uniref:DUF3784 domain-containing protein n=1 Tax=Clostridium sp. CM028 TaxID=2851575 RepID=UPI001C6E8D3D|nr:DUF3784 domain-containing protein [Clostridium sp. CM028]MBW9147933.1 DUF3784 domain-containing protein [Clostridium sp. CM028]WLC61366.1 DUF3784 domain-containing protein [Clostridium sp. CM028]
MFLHFLLQVAFREIQYLLFRSYFEHFYDIVEAKIAGFNTMSKKEKEEYNVVSLCKYTGKFMFMIDFCIILFVLSNVFAMKVLFNIGLMLFFVALIFTIIYSNTGDRFKR